MPVLRTERRAAARLFDGESLEYDAELFEELRALRRRLADEQDVPAFVVFGDVSLRHMAASRPVTAEAFARVPGVGQAKLAAYGEAFTDVVRRYVEAHGIAAAEEPSRADALRRAGAGERAAAVDARQHAGAAGRGGCRWRRLRRSGGSRRRRCSGHIESLDRAGEALEVGHLAPSAERMRRIEEAFSVCGSAFLRPVWEYLGSEFGYDEIRVARVCLRQAGRLEG